MDVVGILKSILVMVVGIVSGVINTGGSLDSWAGAHNIHLSILALLLFFEVMWSLAFIFMIQKGFHIGMGIYFFGTFLLVAAACGYIICGILYTQAVASNTSFWLFTALQNLMY